MALHFTDLVEEKPKAVEKKTAAGRLDFSDLVDAVPAQSGGLNFADIIAGTPSSRTSPTFGQEQPLSFDESKSLLTWTPPAKETIIRAPLKTDVNAPESMQPVPQDVINLLSQVSPAELAKAKEALSPTPQNRSDLGLFKAAGLEGAPGRAGRFVGGVAGGNLGAKVGELIGNTIEDVANPATLAETALLSAGTDRILRPILSKFGVMATREAIDAAASKASTIAEDAGRLPLYPKRPAAKEQIYRKTQSTLDAMGFADEPAEFKVLDQLPTRAIIDPITGKSTQQLTPTLPDETVRSTVDKAIAEPLPTSGVTTPNLTVQSAKDVVDAARALQQRNPDFVVEGDSVNRLFQRIGTAVRTGVISIDDLSPKFREAGYTPSMVADLYETSVSQGAKVMNQLSQFARELNNTVKQRIVGMPDLPPSPFDTFYSWGKNVMNIWRTALTSTLATASRNFVTGMKLVGMETINEAAVAAEKSIFLRQPLKQSMEPLMEHIYAIGRRLTPSGRTQLADVLDKEPLLKVKLYGTPVSDALMTDRVSRILSTFNRTQEYFVREISTAAGVARRMAEAGLDPKKSPVPFKILDAAIQDALEITMAATPRNAFAVKAIKAFNEFYPLQLAYPFPRYLANAVGTLYKWSVAKPIAMAISGDLYKLPVEERLRVINRAVIGSSMMAAAAYLRTTKYAGENWYEVKTDPVNNPGKVVDLRPYGPLLPGHLFITELYNRLQRKAETGQPIGFSAKDYMEGTLGINRMAGTTLFSVSQVSGKNIENVSEFVARYAGEFLGGFSTEFRTFRDLISYFAPEEATPRDVRQAPLTGPFLSNIPFVNRILPEKNYATSTENKREEMGTRQLLGWSVQTKDPLRVELDRLQVPPLKVEPRTGIPEMDNLVRGEMARILEKQGPTLIRGKYYQDRHTSDKDRIDALSALISSVKDNAIGKIMLLRPDLRKQMEEKDAKKRLMERTVGTGGIQ